jgi:hypothetical protein
MFNLSVVTAENRESQRTARRRPVWSGTRRVLVSWTWVMQILTFLNRCCTWFHVMLDIPSQYLISWPACNTKTLVQNVGRLAGCAKHSRDFSQPLQIPLYCNFKQANLFLPNSCLLIIDRIFSSYSILCNVTSWNRVFKCENQLKKSCRSMFCLGVSRVVGELILTAH